MNQKGRKFARFFFLFSWPACQSKQSLSLYFLYSSLSWSQRSLSRFPEVYFTSPLSLYAPHSLLLLLLALSPSLYHSISLSFTSSLPLIDPYSFQGFPSALLLPIAPLITACCIADRRDTSCALSLFSLTISLSLSHPPLQLSFSHNFTFHTLWHSDSETYAIQLQLQYARALKTHFVYISRTIPLQFLLLYLYLSFSLTCFQMQAIQG